MGSKTLAAEVVFSEASYTFRQSLSDQVALGDVVYISFPFPKLLGAIDETDAS